MTFHPNHPLALCPKGHRTISPSACPQCEADQRQRFRYHTRPPSRERELATQDAQEAARLYRAVQPVAAAQHPQAAQREREAVVTQGWSETPSRDFDEVAIAAAARRLRLERSRPRPECGYVGRLGGGR